LVFDPLNSNNKELFRIPSHNNRRNKDIRYGFDHVFDENSTQQEVFENTTKFLIDDVLNGYNATVFAYGATGCGKTYTITGTAKDPGIIPRTMNELFNKIEE
jgi:ATP-dependent RNA circularization protein (DNA/RNA ligase family)